MSHPVIPPYVPKHKIRIVTAASLFDGHDAAINIPTCVGHRFVQHAWRILSGTGKDHITR